MRRPPGRGEKPAGSSCKRGSHASTLGSFTRCLGKSSGFEVRGNPFIGWDFKALAPFSHANPVHCVPAAPELVQIIDGAGHRRRARRVVPAGEAAAR